MPAPSRDKTCLCGDTNNTHTLRSRRNESPPHVHCPLLLVGWVGPVTVVEVPAVDRVTPDAQPRPSIDPPRARLRRRIPEFLESALCR